MSFYGYGQEFALLEDALEAGGIAWWLMELPSKMVFFSVNKLIMMGYSKDDVHKFVRYTDFTERIHPDDYASAMKAMTDHLEGRTPLYETQYRIKAKDGSYLTFYDRGRIVGRKGKELAIAGIVLNITSNAPGTTTVPTPTAL